MKRMSVFSCAILLLFVVNGTALAWNWDADETLLNPTGFPLGDNSYARFTVMNSGPYEALSWVFTQPGGSLECLIPEITESGKISGWTTEYSYFNGISVPSSGYDIDFGEWNPAVQNDQLALTSYFETPIFYRNNSTSTEPSWVEMPNPFSGVITPDPPYGMGVGNVDWDENPDAVFFYDNFLMHYEWDDNDGWAPVDTLIEFSDFGWPLEVRCRDIDKDGDMDFLTVSDQPCEWWAYDLIVNNSDSNNLLFSEPRRLPTWHGQPDAGDVDNDGVMELCYHNGFARALPNPEDGWDDPVTFVPGAIEFFDRDATGNIRFLSRPVWYETPGMRWTIRSGVLTTTGFEPTAWAGDVLSDTHSDEGFNTAQGACLIDLNNDNIRDLILLGFEGQVLSFRNDGSEEVPDFVSDNSLFTFEANMMAQYMDCSDLDGNGINDLLFHDGGAWVVYMGYVNEGELSWIADQGVAQGIIDVGSGKHLFGDFDGDGDGDMVVIYGVEGNLYLNKFNGSERIWELVPDGLPEEISWQSFLLSFDFNQDGMDDIVNGTTIYYSRYNQSVEPDVELPTSSSISVVPNPFNNQARVTVTLNTAGHARVELFNLLGQRVALLHEGKLTAGQHSMNLDGQALSSGAYLLRATAPNLNLTRRVMLLK